VKADGTSPKHTALTFSGAPVKSVDAPGITCRDGWGSVPCLMAWVSITGSACVHWGKFDVLADGSVSLYEDYAVSCLWGYQTPQLANVDTDATKLFRMTFRQEGSVGNGNRIYTFRHVADTSQAWTDQQSFAVNPWVLSPTYGAYDYQNTTGTWLTEQDIYYVVTNN
jgi:hypothetical protein